MEYSLWGYKELDMTEYLDSYACSPELSVYHLPLIATGTPTVYYLTPVRMTLLKKSTNAGECGERKEPTRLYCWWECKLVQPLWKTIWRSSKKLKVELPYRHILQNQHRTESLPFFPSTLNLSSAAIFF